MPTDPLVEEREKREAEEAEKKSSWWNRAPLGAKIIAAAFLLLRGWMINNAGGDMKELIWWALGLLGILYLFGKSWNQAPGILTPEDFDFHIKRELERMKREGQTPWNFRYRIFINKNLQFTDAVGKYYIGRVITNQEGHKEMRALMPAYPIDGKVICTLQESFGKVTGLEAVPKKMVMPDLFKELNKYGLGSALFRRPPPPQP